MPSWTIPSGGPTAYILQAGSAPGLSNLANLDLRQAQPTFTTSGVPAGTYYVRVLARRNNCSLSAPSNEVIVGENTFPLSPGPHSYVECYTNYRGPETCRPSVPFVLAPGETKIVRIFYGFC